MLYAPSFSEKTLFVAIFLLAIFSGTIIFILSEASLVTSPVPEKTSCTMEAKQCPDGSYVGRIPPDCAFASCPQSSQPSASGLESAAQEKAVISYLLTLGEFTWKTRADGHVFCALENLDPAQQLFPLELWVACSEFSYHDGRLEENNGVSTAARIDYPNELSFYDNKKFSYRRPANGNGYADSVKTIFSQKAQVKIFGHDGAAMQKRLQLQALDWFRAQENQTSWDALKKSVEDCEAATVFQTHDLIVKAELKNGLTLYATEPKIDDVLKAARSAQEKCGLIKTATE